jgi:phosphatidylserine/phosphatidylglycerophosphate/cardiolipin synthase-like enzyme
MKSSMGDGERWVDRARAALLAADASVGQGVERLVVDHHRRRLRRIEQRGALDAPAGGWAVPGRPPRAGNRLEVLVDGAEALPRIADAIESAERSAWLAGWYFSPGFHMRPHDRGTLTDLLAEAARRVEVRVLIWAGAPLPLFRPDRENVREVAEALRAAGVTVALDSRERPMHCHHEKLVIVDGETAFVGGIDLTEYNGNRLDSSKHPARGTIGWHDVATELHGPIVADVADHFGMRWAEVTGDELPAPPPQEVAGDMELQLVRTVPERIYDGLPRGEFTILESYMRALRSAQRLIYLENQFLWSPEIIAVLEEKLRHPPDPEFRLLAVLPSRPNSGADDTRGQLGVLAEADHGRGRLLACTLYQRGDSPLPVYVHAKVGIVDDRWLTIGSANLNEHSLFNDTEVNIVSHDAELARATRLRLWSEHTGRPVEELDGDPAAVIDDIWRPIAEEQLARREWNERLTHHLVRLPHVSRRAEALRGPLSGLLVDG